jgi:hypothetical protein
MMDALLLVCVTGTVRSRSASRSRRWSRGCEGAADESHFIRLLTKFCSDKYFFASGL